MKHFLCLALVLLSLCALLGACEKAQPTETGNKQKDTHFGKRKNGKS